MERPTGSFVNTVSGSDNNQKNTQTIHFTLRFDSSVAPSSDALNINNLNIFIITDRGSKRKEIHVAGYRPTQLANTELFGCLLYTSPGANDSIPAIHCHAAGYNPDWNGRQIFRSPFCLRWQRHRHALLWPACRQEVRRGNGEISDRRWSLSCPPLVALPLSLIHI